MFERTANGPHFHFFDAALVQQAGELARRGPRGYHIVEQGHMPIVMGANVKGAPQIPPPLTGTEPGLLRGCLGATQQLLIARNAGDLAEGGGYLFSLIEAAPPLPPPVQGNRDDDFWGLVSLQMIGQQACEQWRQQDLAGVFQLGNEHGVGGLIVANDLQPLPGWWPALAAAADQLLISHVFRQGGRAQCASGVGLVQGLSTPATKQWLAITILLAEQTAALPVGVAAKDRTCFG